MSVELRNAGGVVANSMVVLNTNSVTSKKQRLQKVFRTKIQRQLREIKTWRIGFRNKLEVSRVNDGLTGQYGGCGYEYCRDYNCQQNYLMN